MQEWSPLYDAAGRQLSFSFRVEQVGDELTILIQGRWHRDHNRDYLPGLELLLSRLAALDAVLLDCWVDSEYTRRLGLSRKVCRLPIRGWQYPVRLNTVTDWMQFRLDLLHKIGQVGLPPEKSGSHTPLKTIRLAIDLGRSPLEKLLRQMLQGKIR
jgi:hypothetical protein